MKQPTEQFHQQLQESEAFPAMEDYNKRQTRRALQTWWRTLRSCWCGTLPLFLLVSSWIFLISFLLCRILINKQTNKHNCYIMYFCLHKQSFKHHNYCHRVTVLMYYHISWEPSFLPMRKRQTLQEKEWPIFFYPKQNPLHFARQLTFLLCFWFPLLLNWVLPVKMKKFNACT